MTPSPRNPAPLSPTHAVTLDVHGGRVGLVIEPAELRQVAARLLPTLIVDPAASATATAGNSAPIDGVIREFRESDVMRCVSRDAVAVTEEDPAFHPLLELFRTPDGSRWWIVDERWGLCEVDLIRRTFRGFVLPEPAIDSVRLFEQCVWWPIAQLLRGHGLNLIPATSVGRGGNGVLILSPFEIASELRAMVGRGITAIGQRWTALRFDSNGTPRLLAMPGLTPEAASARPLQLAGQTAVWSDLSPPVERSGTCKLVLIVESIRRGRTANTPMTAADAQRAIREAWPISAIGPSATAAAPAELARSAAVHRVRLGRNPSELADLLLGTPNASAAARAA